MAKPSTQARTLFVTPDAIFVPTGKGKISQCGRSCACGFSATLSSLIGDLLEEGIDVHVAQPDYRNLFGALALDNLDLPGSKLPAYRLHLARDRIFFYTKWLDSNAKWENIRISLAFQREVINNIIPWVQPDLIHCHDWFTGLIPAIAKKLGIPCLFTVHRIQTARCLLSDVEEMGIDGGQFWQHLFFERFPDNYEETRDTNPVDLLLSGIIAAYRPKTVAPKPLADFVARQQLVTKAPVGQMLDHKCDPTLSFELLRTTAVY
jgi:starch synthase/alpha-amylase